MLPAPHRSVYSRSKDALNDLQVFASINIAIVLVGGLLKRLIGEVVSDDATDAEPGQLLQNTYQVGGTGHRCSA